MKFTKYIFSAALAALFALSAAAEVTVDDPSFYEKFKDQGISLNVYNWGEYISDGTEDSMDVIAEFEEISGIDVNYTMYDTNEDMYAKLAHGGSQYDIIIPSDYMIARLIDEDMIEKLDYANIPNIKYIDEKYLKTEFDPNGEYAVPYTWNLVGMVYNTKYVTEEQASSWNLLWDEAFKGKVLMFGNSRDAYAIALKMLGYSLNPTEISQIEEATELLTAQKKVNQMYAMDQTFDKMANENAYAAPYYAGDCVTMMGRNDALAFSYPKEGVNLFIDSICIPKGTENKEAAEAFINFLCETEVAAANCDFISYFTPQVEAAKICEYDERIIPGDSVYDTAEAFTMLADDVNTSMEQNWLKLRSSSGFDDNKGIIILAVVLLLALIIFIIVAVVRKKNKKELY